MGRFVHVQPLLDKKLATIQFSTKAGLSVCYLQIITFVQIVVRVFILVSL